MNPIFLSVIADATAATNNFFTPTNILSVGVATAAVTVATNTLFALFKVPKKTTAFIAALVVAYLAVWMETSPQSYEWILAFFNACLLFCSAFGLNQLASGEAQGIAGPRRFFTSWLS